MENIGMIKNPSTFIIVLYSSEYNKLTVKAIMKM